MAMRARVLEPHELAELQPSGRVSADRALLGCVVLHGTDNKVLVSPPVLCDVDAAGTYAVVSPCGAVIAVATNALDLCSFHIPARPQEPIEHNVLVKLPAGVAPAHPKRLNRPRHLLEEQAAARASVEEQIKNYVHKFLSDVDLPSFVIDGCPCASCGKRKQNRENPPKKKAKGSPSLFPTIKERLEAAGIVCSGEELVALASRINSALGLDAGKEVSVQQEPSVQRTLRRPPPVARLARAAPAPRQPKSRPRRIAPALPDAGSSSGAPSTSQPPAGRAGPSKRKARTVGEEAGADGEAVGEAGPQAGPSGVSWEDNEEEEELRSRAREGPQEPTFTLEPRAAAAILRRRTSASQQEERPATPALPAPAAQEAQGGCRRGAPDEGERGGAARGAPAAPEVDESPSLSVHDSTPEAPAPAGPSGSDVEDDVGLVPLVDEVEADVPAEGGFGFLADDEEGGPGPAAAESERAASPASAAEADPEGAGEDEDVDAPPAPEPSSCGSGERWIARAEYMRRRTAEERAAEDADENGLARRATRNDPGEYARPTFGNESDSSGDEEDGFDLLIHGERSEREGGGWRYPGFSLSTNKGEVMVDLTTEGPHVLCVQGPDAIEPFLVQEIYETPSGSLRIAGQFLWTFGQLQERKLEEAEENEKQSAREQNSRPRQTKSGKRKAAARRPRVLKSKRAAAKKASENLGPRAGKGMGKGKAPAAQPDAAKDPSEDGTFFVMERVFDWCSVKRIAVHAAPPRVERVYIANIHRQRYRLAPPPNGWARFDRPLRVLEPFAGCGGFHSGMARAGGFRTTCFVDRSEEASSAFKLNFDRRGKMEFGGHRMDVADFLGRCRAGEGGFPGPGAFDACVCGPPCQPNSIANSGKMTEKTVEAGLASIALVLDLADFFKFSLVVVENVTGMLTNRRSEHHDPGEVYYALVGGLLRRGYQVQAFVSKAANVGTAQIRYRLFVVAVTGDYKLPFPPPITHDSKKDILTVAGRDLFGSAFVDLDDDFRKERGEESFHKLVSCLRTYSDLPRTPSDDLLSYSAVPKNAYQKLMRWSASEGRLLERGEAMRHAAPAQPRRPPPTAGAGRRDAGDGDEEEEEEEEAGQFLEEEEEGGAGAAGSSSEEEDDEEQACTMTRGTALQQRRGGRACSVRELMRLASFDDSYELALRLHNNAGVVQMLGDAVLPLHAKAVFMAVKRALLAPGGTGELDPREARDDAAVREADASGFWGPPAPQGAPS
eukprot:tig00021254_g19678.t2